MISRAFSCLVLVFVLCGTTRAEIANPDLLGLAQSYRSSIEPADGGASPVETLKLLNEARKAGNIAEIVRLSERLVALGDQSVQAWLALSKAWLQSDPAAVNGLASAIQAEQVSQNPGDRLEALLLASTFLRGRLDKERDRYDQALAAVKAADAALAQALDLATQEKFAAPDPDNPDGRIQSLEKVRDDARDASDGAAADISRTAAALNEVYQEIHAALPGTNLDEMRGNDKRLAFDVEITKDSDVAVDYKADGSDVRACFTFTKKLQANSRVYGSKVSLSTGNASVPPDAYDVRAEGDTLCFMRLEHGKAYQTVLSADLPAEDETVLGKEVAAYIQLPDLGPRIGFGDGEFMLPRSGPGELPISLTNIENFPLAIHRVVDRSLSRHLALGHIRNGIPDAEYQDLLIKFSEVMWQGNARRLMKDKERNTSVRTFVPVRTILDDRTAWIREIDPSGWERTGELHSTVRDVREVSDEQLRISGNFVAGNLDINPETAGAVVPGIYALVAPVPDPGPNKEFHCGDSDNCAVFAAQWFVVSDIGLTFYEGQQHFDVMARSLASGGPVAEARIQLVAQGNRVLGEALTDANGVARFPRSLTTGEASNKLIAIMAELKDDFSYLQYGNERLDLSRLNVGGPLQGPENEALIYTDRGIYQPGETVQAFAIMRDRANLADALRGAEMRLEIQDYVVKTKPLTPDEWKSGGSLVSIDLPPTARAGSAVLKLVSAANDVLAESRMQIGKIRPDRARLELRTTGDGALRASRGPDGNAVIAGRARAQYLYGAEGTGQAAAADLKAEVSVRVSPVDAPLDGCYEGFAFGNFDDESLPTVSRSFVDYTDADGMLPLRLSGIRLPSTKKPLAATVEVTLFDASGPLAGEQADVAIPPEKAAVGISAVPRLSLAEADGYRLSLDIASIGADGAADLDRALEISVERELESYAWENVDGVWQHIPLRQREPVSSRQLRLRDVGSLTGASQSCAGFVAVPDAATGLANGRYVVTVTDPASGAVASVRFGTGVTQTSVKDLEPNIFVLSSAKQRYAPGEKVSLTVEAPFQTGKILVAVADDDVLGWFSGEVRDGKGTVSFDAAPAWASKGVHALATVFKEDAGNVRQFGPARAIGATYFEISSDDSVFDLSIRRQTAGLDDFLRPGEPLQFDVCVNGATGECGGSPSADSYAVAFVVDEGLLSLTGHEAEAEKLRQGLLGNRQLSLRMMDNYSRLLLKEGGDRPGRLALSNYTSTRIVAAAKGPVALENGRASFTFDDPGLQAGSLKIHVVGWSASHVASAGDTVAVRHFLVSSLGVPEFFLAGDEPVLPLRMENVSFIDHPGDYALSFKVDGGIGISLLRKDGRQIERDATGAFLLRVPQGEPQDLLVELDIPQKIEGNFDLSLDLSAVGAAVDLPPQERHRSWSLAVRPSTVAAQEYLSFPLGQSTNLAALLEGVVRDRYDPETVKVVARFASTDDVLRVASTETVPADTASVLEEMVWLGLVDLQDPALAGDGRLKGRIQANVEAVQALQLADGVFAPYRTMGDFIPSEVGFDRNARSYTIRHGLLRNASALDFLIRASKAGYRVSPDAIRNSTSFIQDRVGEAINAARLQMDTETLCSFDTRYAMLLLAQLDRLSVSDVQALGRCRPGAAESGGEEAADVDIVEAVAQGPVLSELVTLAILSQFGEVVDVQTALSARYPSPADYLGDLDQYRKAIAVSMLANTRVDAKVVARVTGSLIKQGKPLDLRTRAWLARSVADLDAPGNARLTLADIEVSDPDVMNLSERADGIVESGEVGYLNLEDLSLTVEKTGGPDARGFLRISGRLVDGQDLALPETSLRHRLFRASNGKEIDPANETLAVGDRLVVVVEATSEALAGLADQDMSDISWSYGPLVVEAPLPSALTLVSDDLSGIKPKGDLAKVTMAGNLRSVSSHPQGWRAVIVPQSSQGVATHEESEEAGEAQEGQEGQGPEAEAGVEFRQAFVVSVASAGSFLFPSTTLDPLDFPGNTLLSRTETLKVSIPGAPSP